MSLMNQTQPLSHFASIEPHRHIAHNRKKHIDFSIHACGGTSREKLCYLCSMWFKKLMVRSSSNSINIIVDETTALNYFAQAIHSLLSRHPVLPFQEFFSRISHRLHIP